ncbi:MAG TPA: hypothetical protein VM598_13380 [Bdellovibrionota bacterium]|nr:hypothetical protein [Bdellovibrionota bacterium]
MKAGILAALAILVSIPAAANDGSTGGRGTEDYILMGRAKLRRMTAPELTKFYREIEELNFVVSNGIRERLAAFFRQADAERFLPAKAGYSPKEDFLKLRQLGAAEKLDGAHIYASSNCAVQSEPKSAATHPKPGSDICVNPERVALLDLMLADEGEELIPDTANPGRPRRSMLFGVLMHEVARWYGMDDSHEFLLGMAPEGSRQFIVLSAPAGTNVAAGQFSRNLSSRIQAVGQYGYDASRGDRFTVQLTEHARIPGCLGEIAISSFSRHGGKVVETAARQQAGLNAHSTAAEFRARDLTQVRVTYGRRFFSLGCAATTTLEVLNENQENVDHRMPFSFRDGDARGARIDLRFRRWSPRPETG